MEQPKLTVDEFKQRYAAARAVDRLERQQALQHLRNHWRQYLLDAVCQGLMNTAIGYAAGLAFVYFSLTAAVPQIAAGLSKACGG